MIFSVFVYLTLLVSLVFCGRYQNYRIKFFDNPIPINRNITDFDLYIGCRTSL